MLLSLRFAALAALAAATLPSAHAATYVVDTASDTGATDCAGGGRCTLRAAIEAANSRVGLDRIEFDLPQATTIAPLSVLPALIDHTTLDARPSSAHLGRPWVVLDGLVVPSSYGLVVAGADAAGSDIYGLGFANWDSAALLLTGSADGMRIDGCEFGYTASGAIAGNGLGLHVDTDSNTIGQTFGASGGVGAGNVFAASLGDGLLITGNSNRVRGNVVGGDGAGSGNGKGIRIANGIGNRIGDTSAGGVTVGNFIGHNSGDAIVIQGNGNSVVAALVGLAANGTPRPNGGNGIVVAGQDNVIGGSAPSQRNQVAYNTTGILLGSPAAANATEVVGNVVYANLGTGIRILSGTGNLLEGNRIQGNGTGGVGDGVRIDGDSNVLVDNRIGIDGGNNGEGIYLSGSADGNTVGPGNLVGNNRSGVKAQGDTIVIGNTIGTAGNGNAFDGVWLAVGSGGSEVSDNAIDDSGGHGVRSDSVGNSVLDNRLGVVAGNSNAGVFLSTGGSGNLVQGNIIGNNTDGVLVQGAGNRVQGNFIGVLPDGGNIGNSRYGVRAQSTATGVFILDNRIEGNDDIGILVQGANADVCGNQVGGTSLGGGAFAGLGNAQDGIVVQQTDHANIGGSCLDGNLVVLNSGDGVRLDDVHDALVGNNKLHSNAGAGISLVNGSHDQLLQYNAIHDNAMAGVLIDADAGERNEFRSNRMSGNGIPGIDLLGDGGRTANDPGDADSGPNRLQNAPVLMFHAPVEGAQLELGLFVDSSTEHAQYPLRVQVFAAAGELPPGEGAVSLGWGEYTAPGVATITVDNPPEDSSWLLAVATDDDGNSSEFSQAIAWSWDDAQRIFRDGFED